MTNETLKKYMWVDEYAYGSLTRALTWRLAARTLKERHPTTDLTVQLFRSNMRMNARDAVRHARLAADANRQYGIYRLRGVV